VFVADDWNRASHEMKKNPYGTLELRIPPNAQGEVAIKHDSKIKVSLNQSRARREEEMLSRETKARADT